MSTSSDEYVPPTTFTLAPDEPLTGNGTSKICYCIEEKHIRDWLRTITPGLLTRVFGERTDWCEDPDKGYLDPEWYWNDDLGGTWGIGFRHGVPRLRGNWHNSDAARRFVHYLQLKFVGKYNNDQVA